MSSKYAVAPQPEPVLSVEGLTVSFGINGIDHVAVDSVSWNVHPGEVVALVGESGSGKSATALAVAGLLPHSATAKGTVQFDGRNLLDLSEDRMRDIRGQRIAMIFQDPLNALDPVFTIGSQISELLRVHNPRLSSAQAKSRALELLRSVNMPDPELKLTQYPHQLSGGQCQRVMIAMALSSEPDVLLADEPTTALDVTVQQSVLDLLRDIADRTNTGIVLITHDMGVVADIADQVIVMRSGRIVEKAAVRPLFAAPKDPYTQDLLSAVPGRAQSRPKPPVDGHTAPLLAVEDLVVEYSSRSLGKKRTLRAVDQVSFDVRPGEVFGLVGESGSGKSTIGKALVGLAPISAGSVRISDVRIGRGTRRDLRRARRRIGVIFQNPTASLDPRRSIGDALDEPLSLLGRLRGTDLTKRRAELLESVELPAKWAERYPHELSGGQRQRVAIARALSLHPELIIADEPTSALDVSVQATVLELLARLQAEHRFACVFVSHDLAVVGQMCHRVAVLQSGQIVEQGTADQVLTQPRANFARQLLQAAPIPDPVEQSRRRTERLKTN
ncbi:dipeptide ABC transporter ATP-binding protein [Paenarthrobacter sp. NPDC091669]|uniref:dipeptide ABC transporter ATP-binding protein n=1 Tax=Paenarthrobacter sp. NPDC091669 TaxID=3364384 RepID=UPI00380AB0B5